MNILDRFRSAQARRDAAIAASDAEIARAAAKRQAEIDAWSLRARTRQSRAEAAVETLATLIEPLAAALDTLDVDASDIAGVVVAAFRRADARCGLSDDSLHWCSHSPTAATLAQILAKNLYFVAHRNYR